MKVGALIINKLDEMYNKTRSNEQKILLDFIRSHPSFNYKNGKSGEILFSEDVMNKCFYSNNGCRNLRRESVFGKIFEHKTILKNNKVIGVILEGYKKDLIDKNIPTHILKEFGNKKNKYCVNCGTTKDLQIDHKNGRYTLKDKNDINEYQFLCRNCNINKRQHCYKCIKTKTKFDAKKIGYNKSCLSENLEYIDSCEGCYWENPLKWKIIKENNE